MKNIKFTIFLLQFIFLTSAIQTAKADRVLTLTVYIEGLYNPVTNIMVEDTVEVYLTEDDSPFQIIDSAKVYLNSSGVGTFITEIENEYDIRIVVKHRNSIETWGNEATFYNDTLSYNFSASASQAYGNNLKLKGDEYCIYSGDVDQNGLIELEDESLVENDAFDFVSGYTSTDLNGDGIADIADIAIVSNNAPHFITVMRPPYINYHTPSITVANLTINGAPEDWITCFSFFDLPVGAVLECDFISTDPDFEEHLDDTAYFSPRDLQSPTVFNATVTFTPTLPSEGPSPLVTHMTLQFHSLYIGYIKWESYDLADHEERCVLFFNYSSRGYEKLNDYY
ncbi:MAG: hypothetical protein M3R36_14285 [Bacteroidota bacterium]|nr:hypothetical protein [Bacteroidota bacterium]